MSFGFAASGLRANPAESDLSLWWVFSFAAWGFGANPAESDLSLW